MIHPSTRAATCRVGGRRDHSSQPQGAGPEVSSGNAEDMMPNFVLVHGAWHGGWCYRGTANELRGRGHVVVTPTLTGVGERFHASSEAITLETHILDVVGCIEAEELDQVVLCGHSYAGMVITGAADRMAERIKTLVYLDAFVPEHGDSCHFLLPTALAPEGAVQFLEGVR